jgi:hypothetical protein
VISGNLSSVSVPSNSTSEATSGKERFEPFYFFLSMLPLSYMRRLKIDEHDMVIKLGRMDVKKIYFMFYKEFYPHPWSRGVGVY